MTDYGKIRFIDWHKDTKVYLVNCIIMIVVFIMMGIMDKAGIGFMMILALHAFMLTYFLISNILSEYNTLTLLVNNLWHILFANSLFGFWVSDMLIAVPIFILVALFTRKALFSIIVLVIMSLILCFAAKKFAKYCKSQINSWVF